MTARAGFDLRRLLAGALCIFACVLLGSITQAQTNSWASPSRGFWDDSESWSLGVRPTNSQSVFLTNALSKTVTIDSYTSGTYPESLTISNLTVSAPNGATNTLFLSNAGLVTPLSVLDILDVDTNGALVVNGSAVQVSSNLFVNATISITNGGQVYSSSASGDNNAISGNGIDGNVQVSGTGSVWSNSGSLFIFGNTLTVSDGGAVYSSGGGAEGYVSTGTALVMGAGSVWNDNGDFYIGYGDTFFNGALVIANGGAVYDDNGRLGNPWGVSVLVTGTGSIWNSTNGVYFGGYGGSSLVISNGGAVYDSGASMMSEGDDAVVVTGSGSVWSNGTLLSDEPYASLLISEGGKVYCESANMADNEGSLYSVTVTGTNSVLSIGSNLSAAYEGGRVSLLIADGGVVSAGTVNGSLGNAPLNITISEGDLYVGSLGCNGGSMLTFTGGLLSSGGTVVTNSQTIVVGDGTDAATFQLAGGGSGIHSFENGLTISSNAFLTGCGTIEGSVVVDPGGTVLANCGGTLTFTGIVTNNGTMQAINGSTLEAYGTVVNNGTIDAINGSTNFHGGFINNGTVLAASSVKISQASISGQNYVVQIPSVTNHTYQLQFTPTLKPANWANTSASQSGNNGVLTFTDPGGATNLPSRFYRVDVTAP